MLHQDNYPTLCGMIQSRHVLTVKIGYGDKLHAKLVPGVHGNGDNAVGDTLDQALQRLEDHVLNEATHRRAASS